ncbi:hypothetical protein Pfo_001255 [Paulownia fortunei]|nr:hypothetical protein Pfo_001255 [Paulownia fortunei]
MSTICKAQPKFFELDRIQTNSPFAIPILPHTLSGFHPHANTNQPLISRFSVAVRINFQKESCLWAFFIIL